MKQFLIIGAGQLGRSFFDVLGIENCELVRLRDHTPEEIREKIQTGRFDCVVNCAAWTDVKGAEDPKNRFLVDLLNIAWPAQLARICADCRVPFVTFSTDYVFDGTKGEPCEPDDAVRPVNYYGHSKAAGEALLKRMEGEIKIVRTAGLFSRHGSNFISRAIAQHMRGESVVRPDRYIVSITDAGRLAGYVARNFEHLPTVSHYVTSLPVTWYQVAVEIGMVCGFRPEIGDDPADPVTRPLYSALSNAQDIDWPYQVRHVAKDILREGTRKLIEWVVS